MPATQTPELERAKTQLSVYVSKAADILEFCEWFEPFGHSGNFPVVENFQKEITQICECVENTCCPPSPAEHELPMSLWALLDLIRVLFETLAE